MTPAMSPNENNEFDRMVGREFGTETIDATPYGMHPHHVKTGLTPRGKALLAFSATALAATVAVGWQISSSNAAEAEQKAMEIALKRDQLELEKLKVVNQVTADAAKTQATVEAARQVKVDACVKANKSLVGKQLGATYRSVLDDCQAQYGAATDIDMQAAGTSTDIDMQAAGTSTDTTDGGSGGGEVNAGFLVGGVALAGFMAVALRKTRRNPA